MIMIPYTHLECRLIAIAKDAKWLMRALAEARKLGLKNWCIGAGAVRSVVWDALHGFTSPTPVEDIDLVYFDPARTDIEADRALAASIPEVFPGARWEVVNQAGVHVWYPAPDGRAPVPFVSIEEGIASWPEYATAVALSVDEGGALTVIAPHGLDDLFSMVVRHNPLRATIGMYRERIARKAFPQRWPMVTVHP